jgi:hypothetical protein
MLATKTWALWKVTQGHQIKSKVKVMALLLPFSHLLVPEIPVCLMIVCPERRT